MMRRLEATPRHRDRSIETPDWPVNVPRFPDRRCESTRKNAVVRMVPVPGGVAFVEDTPDSGRSRAMHER